MSKTENNNKEIGKGKSFNPKISDSIGSTKMQSVLQELQIMATQKGGNRGFDISNFDKEQIDKLLETVSENEKNAYQFHTKRIDAIKEIELEKIKASSINKVTIKYLLIGSILVVIPGITLLILFFKDTYFIPWLTFLTGMLGGIGISKTASGLFKKENNNPLLEEMEEE